MERPDYQKELDMIMDNVGSEGRVPSLLLHSCCAPCSSHVLSYLKERFDITVLYFNPSIYPEEEYRHRLAEQERLIGEMNAERGENEREIKLIEGTYDHESFIESIKGLEGEREGGARCRKCFEQRLAETERIAAERGFDYFATTLTVSPHKSAVLINTIGFELASSKARTAWLPSDFKKKDGFKHSIELSRCYDLYRQNYCGCEFSTIFSPNS